MRLDEFARFRSRDWQNQWIPLNMPCDEEHSLSRPVHLSTSLRAFFHTQFTIIIIARANRERELTAQSLVDGGGIVFVPWLRQSTLLVFTSTVVLSNSLRSFERTMNIPFGISSNAWIRFSLVIGANRGRLVSWAHLKWTLDIPVSLLLISKWRAASELALALASMAAAQFTYRRIFLHLKLASMNVAFCPYPKASVCVCFFSFVLQVCYFNKTKEREQ